MWSKLSFRRGWGVAGGRSWYVELRVKQPGSCELVVAVKGWMLRVWSAAMKLCSVIRPAWIGLHWKQLGTSADYLCQVMEHPTLLAYMVGIANSLICNYGHTGTGPFVHVFDVCTILDIYEWKGSMKCLSLQHKGAVLLNCYKSISTLLATKWMKCCALMVPLYVYSVKPKGYG